MVATIPKQTFITIIIFFLLFCGGGVLFSLFFFSLFKKTSKNIFEGGESFVSFEVSILLGGGPFSKIPPCGQHSALMYVCESGVQILYGGC